MELEILDTLIETRTTFLEDGAILFKGESEIEKELNGYITGENSLQKIENVLQGTTGIEIIDRMQLHRISPRAGYYGRVIPRIRALTRAVTGCRSEEELFETIANETDENSSKIKLIYRKMSLWLKNNSSKVLKKAILAGLGVGFLAYLKGLQREETGCFRYDSKGNRVKIPERSCSSSGGGPILIPPHPLQDISWGCDYDITPLKQYDAGRVLDKGCKGICDPRAYDVLYRYAPPYDWKPCPQQHDDKYHYVCEKGTIVRAVAREVGTEVGEVFKGLNDAHLFDGFKRIILPIFLVIFLIYINCSFIISCALRDWKAVVSNKVKGSGGHS